MHGRIGVGAVLAALGLVFGCSGEGMQKLAWGASLPGARIPATVTALAVRGDYLDAMVESKVFRLRLLTPDRDDCRAVLELGAQLTFVRLRLFGLLERDEVSCEPVGVASLAEWRDLRTRPPRFDPLPRAQATFHVTWSDEEVVLARGRFPLANQVGFTGTQDLVAMLPNGPECLEPIQDGVASMEFRDAGPQPYSLVTGQGPCPVLGFALPLPDDPDLSEEESPS